jgi:hypothetical protein
MAPWLLYLQLMKTFPCLSLALALTVGFAASTPAVSRAQEEKTPHRVVDPIEPKVLAPQDTETHWYGWQTLLTDAGSFGAALLTQNAYALAAVYVLGAPVVHAAHGRAGAAVGSLALRVALPIAGIYLGAAAANCSAQFHHEDDQCGLTESVIGFGLGMLAASVIDATALSWETVEKKTPTPSFSIAPSVAPIPGGGSMWSLAGTF